MISVALARRRPSDRRYLKAQITVNAGKVGCEILRYLQTWNDADWLDDDDIYYFSKVVVEVCSIDQTKALIEYSDHMAKPMKDTPDVYTLFSKYMREHYDNA